MEEKALFVKSMHSVLNKLAYFVLYPIFIIFGYIMYRDRANDEIFIFGVLVMLGIFLFFNYIFLFKFKIFGKLYFYEDRIVMKDLFKEEDFKYGDYVCVVGKYTSIIESKKHFIFTPIDKKVVVTLVDTSKFGNVITLNKNKVLYCTFDDKLLGFLDDKM